MAIANLDGMKEEIFKVLAFRAEEAETDCWHGEAIVQGNLL